ncbi:hypothetical protein ACNJX9_09350 [Bradyrhizobium sp. DASA03076]|uniref:hypothetical protein n=1 Tax=Bradyrhizobium sp. BLXBL-03 TaxID=3395916 RepID=UPI003F71130B
MPEEVTALAAKEPDLRSAKDILFTAFKDEPVQEWIYGHSLYGRIATRIWIADLLKHGIVSKLSDNSAFAVWFSPEQTERAARRRMSLLGAFSLLRPDSWARKMQLNRKIAQLEYRKPYWYLAAVATATSLKRSGRGTMVLSLGLQRADHDRLPIYLETSVYYSIDFYKLLGFDVVHEFGFEDGPTVWCLHRAPR